MTVKERVLASRLIEKANRNTKYAEELGLSCSLVTRTQSEKGVTRSCFRSHTEKTAKTADAAKS